MRATSIILFASLAAAQDTSSDADECSAATGVATVTTIKAIQSTYSSAATPSTCGLPSGGSSYPSTMVGQYVEITGVVTAVGTQKDAYSAAYFYMQMTDGSTSWAGVELFKEDHTHEQGDLLTVKGVVREAYGVTEVVECSSTKTGTAVLPDPIAVTTDDFQGCTETAEAYEGMLVKTGEVTVQPCVNDLTTALIAADIKGGYYCQANLEDLSWGECFDKYKQMWIKSTGATGMALELDNHAVELAVEYLCATGPTTYATWTSVTGVMTYAYGTWDLIARSAFDVVGGTGKTPETVGAQSVSITQILQTSVKYGNADGYSGPYTVPSHVLGTQETNSKGDPGYGGYAAPVAGAPWTTGSCPPYEVLDWLDDSGNKTQNLCSCYPPNYYDPGAGDQGSGTTYVTVTGVIQGIDSETGPFYICDESCPSAGGCMFTYRRGSDKLSLGDKVQMTAKVYAYYGLNQFSYPIEIKVLESGKGKCTPTVIDRVFPFTYEAACNSEAEQLEGTEVKVECLKVTMTGDDLDGDGETGDNTRHLQTHSCYVDGEKKYHCILQVEDIYGNKMLVDDGTFGDGTACMFDGTCTGYNGKFVAVGDTFTSITGFIDQRRGSHNTGADYGGYYGLMPHSVGAIDGWASDGWSDYCKEKIGELPSSSTGLSGGAIGGIVGGVLGGLLLGILLATLMYKQMGGGGSTTTATAKATVAAKAVNVTEMNSSTSEDPAGGKV